MMGGQLGECILSESEESVLAPSSQKKKSYHHGNLRESLIEAAIEIIAERGRSEFTLRELAKRLGVTHAATYHHFKDKDDLLSTVAERGYREMGEYLEEASASEDQNPIMKMRRMGAAYIRYAHENQAYFRVMFGQKFADINAYPEMENAGQTTKNMMETLVREGQKAGIYNTEANVEELIAISWATVHGLALLTINGHFEHLREGLELDDYVMRISRHLFTGTGSPQAQVAVRAANTQPPT